MQNTEWIIIDTKTTGSLAPIFVVELAAQRMRGWLPDGPPFHCLLNQQMVMPPEASRVHGNTREILERDGETPHTAYRDFASYVEQRSVAAYNLACDWDDVLLPEWQRLGLKPVGTRGLCLMQLCQRLIDPVPAGNCTLQTLRQYYNLSARDVHTALGNLDSVIDLWKQVLHPLAAARGLNNWNALTAFSQATWFPARIPFGKFKGRLFREALHDLALHDWIAWLAASPNSRSAQMGCWYLAQLDTPDDNKEMQGRGCFVAPSTETALVVFADPNICQLKSLIEAARTSLADLETTYTKERYAVSTTQARLFDLLRPLFQKRDLLKLHLDYRRKYLDALLFSGEESAAAVDEEFKQAHAQTDAEYERAAEASLGRRSLSEEEEVELKQLWRKLVRLFHPDRYMDEEDKYGVYQKLTAEINLLRDVGNLEGMREIADDPTGFIARKGWGTIDLDDSDQLDKLRQLYELLQGQIIELLKALDAMHLSAEYELHQLASTQPDLLARVADEQSRALEEECKALEAELEKIEGELEVLEK